MLRALVLDLDGTIVDTESALYEAWREVYRRRGLTLPLTAWLRAVGSSPDLFDPYRYLEELVSRPLDRDAVRAEAEQIAEEHLRTLEPRPGVSALVRAARRMGLAVGVASSSRRAWVERFVAQAGLAAEVKALAAAEDVQAVKPAPDLYLRVLQALGVDGPEALAVEDSPHGARAALAAGMRCVVVPNQLTQGERFPEGTVLLASLEGWGPEALWTLAGRKAREGAR